ncbi:MAG: zf-HC2 domain-containing protein [Gammaproteobacteria bacterium]|nr:zf-HC2 domain-containing protein [Gammaproteobacteria bacterium]
MNCKQATQLMSESHDHQLTRWQRFSLRVHLLICNGCRAYNKHLDFISKAMQQMRDRF